MKILFVHNYYQQAGGEDRALELESALMEQRGHDVKTIVFRNKNIKGFFKKINTGFSALYNAASAAELERMIKQFHPDIIHIHNLFFVASPSILYISAKNNIPVILTLHNYRLICANALLMRDNHPCELCVKKKFPLAGIKYKCYRNSVIDSSMVTAITSLHKILHTWQRKVTSYIALTEFSKQKILDSSLHLAEKKIVVKPNFVPDLGEGYLPRENFFLFVGRIAKEKGVAMLLEAFAAMPEHKLVVAGDGPESESLKKNYANYENIDFVGQLEKESAREKMKKCRALIFPSIWYEGLPFTIIEAFSTGTPVIASRLGSMGEIIKDGYNGYHFTPSSVDDLRQKVRSFASTDNNKVYFQARQTYLSKYHPDIHYNSIMNIYRTAIAENKASHV